MKTYSFNLSSVVMVAGLLLVGAAANAGQEAPPIPAVTGTMALDGTVQKTYQGINAVVVKTIDGIDHLVHLTERTVVHGGKAAGKDSVRGIEEGSRIVVHLTKDPGKETGSEVDRVANDGLKTVQGVITHVDRQAKTMSIRLEDGSRQTLRLTERAVSDASKDIGSSVSEAAKVVVYYGDDAGQRVAHYFKRIS